MRIPPEVGASWCGRDASAHPPLPPRCPWSGRPLRAADPECRRANRQDVGDRVDPGKPEQRGPALPGVIAQGGPHAQEGSRAPAKGSLLAAGPVHRDSHEPSLWLFVAADLAPPLAQFHKSVLHSVRGDFPVAAGNGEGGNKRAIVLAEEQLGTEVVCPGAIALQDGQPVVAHSDNRPPRQLGLLWHQVDSTPIHATGGHFLYMRLCETRNGDVGREVVRCRQPVSSGRRSRPLSCSSSPCRKMD